MYFPSKRNCSLRQRFWVTITVVLHRIYKCLLVFATQLPEEIKRNDERDDDGERRKKKDSCCSTGVVGDKREREREEESSSSEKNIIIIYCYSWSLSIYTKPSVAYCIYLFVLLVSILLYFFKNGVIKKVKKYPHIINNKLYYYY